MSVAQRNAQGSSDHIVVDASGQLPCGARQWHTEPMLPDSSPATVRDALDLARAALPEARADADRLLAWLCDTNLAGLRARPERVLSNALLRRFNDLVRRRAAGEPLAYLTGQREFWSLSLAVGPGVLVPRPETEGLVEALLARVPANRHGWVADVGCGSGNLSVALAQERAGLQLLAVEFSAAALPWAQRNLLDHGQQRCHLLQGDLLAPVANGCLLAVVANLPYIAADDPDVHPDTDRHEPAQALYAEHDGLALIARLVMQAARALQPGGWLLLEHGWRQHEAVQALLQQRRYGDIETLMDLAGHPRITLGRIPELV